MQNTSYFALVRECANNLAIDMDKSCTDRYVGLTMGPVQMIELFNKFKYFFQGPRKKISSNPMLGSTRSKFSFRSDLLNGIRSGSHIAICALVVFVARLTAYANNV